MCACKMVTGRNAPQGMEKVRSLMSAELILNPMTKEYCEVL